MSDEQSYGWAGKILRVNVGSGAITTQATKPYESYIGGMGLANKIMFDEVPAGTSPFAPENKLILAVGPLTASGVPLAGRSTLCSLSTFTKDHLIVDAHCGGMLGAKLKLAGWDALIIEGASNHPVYINIVDDKVSIKDASFVWGMGTRECTEALCRKESVEACVAAIGPAGENQLPYACIINSRNHSAGAGTGAVLGSKKVKAIVVQGNGSVHLANPQAVADLSDYMLREVIGSNNNHVVPQTQQQWAEFYDKNSRWSARKGLTWGIAEGGAIDTGEPKPGELNTVGYRCMKSVYDLGPAAEKYTIKMDGCHGCPIHCFSDLRIDRTGELGGKKTAGNTCAANFPFNYMNSILKTDIDTNSEDGVLFNTVMGTTMDDLGLWCNYAQLWRDIGHCIKDGVFERVLPPKEKEKYDWQRIYKHDPTIMVELLNHIAQNNSEIAHVAWGPYHWTKRWHDEGWFDAQPSQLINYRGWPVHHATECFGQVGGVYNMFFNRDDMIHSAVNFQGCGLPFSLKQDIAAEVWGGKDAIDQDKNYTPMNDHKANLAWWSVVTNVLHDSLTLCNWTWPMTMSPTKARNYRGDLDLEAKFFTAVTGQEITTDELYRAGERIITLQRANTVRGMTRKDGSYGNNDLRTEHDTMTNWPFDMDPDKAPFSPGTIKMEHNDFQDALGRVYDKFTWDHEKGCPTAACLDAHDMDDVKKELAKQGLLPS